MKTTILLLLLCLGLQVQAQTRLAIVAEDPATSAAADVLTAEFSKRSDLQLLDRAEIQKVYREQGLSAANTDPLKLGRLLGADGLLDLTTVTEKDQKYLELRLIAVKPGVVLSDDRFTSPGTNLLQWCTGVAAHLSQLLPKLTVQLKDAIPISIVNFRSSMSTTEARDLEKQLTLLTIHRLTQQKQLFVLERRSMQYLTRENELNGQDNAFWNGSYLLDGAIDRNGYSPDKMTISARLVPPNGGSAQQIELTGARTNVAAIVDQLTEKILAALKLQPSAPWKPSDEAEQFATDAQWAYRWGLLPQARSASESAWALGLHTKDLAALRIRAYADGIWPGHEHNTEFYIPAVPDAPLLNPLTRALELFYNDTRLEFTNTAQIDEDWYLMGTRLVRVSFEVLDGFYHAAEMREGLEDQLANVRALTRQAISLLDRQTRPIPHPVPVPDHPHTVSNQMFDDLDKFDSAKWKEGCVMFEKPEDAAPMFREMIENGYAPLVVPRFIGWTWPDRKRVPAATKQFIAELCASTNTPLKLQGLCLALIKTPFYPEAQFHQRENEIFTAIWENRDWVLDNPTHHFHDQRLAILPQLAEILNQPDKYNNKYLSTECPLITNLRQRLRVEYLTHYTNYDEVVFNELFLHSAGVSYNDFWTPEQAKEIAPLLETFRPTDTRLSWAKRQIKQRAGLVTATKPVPITPLPAEEVVTARFIPWRISSSHNISNQRSQQQRLILRNSRLWTRLVTIDITQWSGGPSLDAHVGSLAEGGFATDPITAITYISVDPESGNCHEITFPEKAEASDTGFDVSADSLYVSTKGALHRFHLDTEKWERIQVPLEQSARVHAVKGRIFLVAADSLLEVEPDTHSIQIIASSRRQPAGNIADSMWNGGARTYSKSDGTFGAFVANHFLTFAPTSRNWIQGIAAPPRSMLNCQNFSASGDARLLINPAGWTDWILMGNWNGTTNFEPLLEDHKPLPGQPANATTTKPLHQTRWDWPQPFELGSSRMIVEGKALWVLAPRHLANANGAMTEPVTFTDKRNATLLRFEPDLRGSLSVPVNFESHESITNPFDPRQGKFYMEWIGLLSAFPPPLNEPVNWLATPAGLVYEVSALAGHWLVPSQALEARLTALRATQSKEGRKP